MIRKCVFIDVNRLNVRYYGPFQKVELFTFGKLSTELWMSKIIYHMAICIFTVEGLKISTFPKSGPYLTVEATLPQNGVSSVKNRFI